MRRVVITGLGVVSCLGNSKADVLESLRAGKSGITVNEEFQERGMRSQISGAVDIDIADHIDRKVRRFMGNAAAYSYISMQQAIDDSGLEESDISNPRTGIIAGSGGASSSNIVASADILRERGVKRIGPYMVPRTMGSTVSACLATPFKIKGVNYSLTSACATSAHCIGAAAEQIQFGKQDIVFAGGGEEEGWTLGSLFDAMGALSSKYNDTPEKASRPYDTRAVQKSTPSSSVMAQRQMAAIWLRRRAKVPFDVCSSQRRPLKVQSTTSIRMARARRLVIPKNSKPFAKCLAKTCLDLDQANPCVDIHSVRLV